MTIKSFQCVAVHLDINVPVVYMARDVMILMWANPLQGPLEGVGLENRDFFAAWIGTDQSKCHLGSKSRPAAR